MTEKEAPEDVDISIMVESGVYDRLESDAKFYLQELSSLDGKYAGVVDLFVCIVFPKGSLQREIDSPEDYARLWGVEHNERYLKGFIVLEIPDAVL